MGEAWKSTKDKVSRTLGSTTQESQKGRELVHQTQTYVPKLVFRATATSTADSVVVNKKKWGQNIKGFVCLCLCASVHVCACMHVLVYVCLYMSVFVYACLLT